MSESFPTRHWHALPDGRVQCDVCPRHCRLAEGQRGLCFVRARERDAVVLTTWGRSSGYCVDPIEKKPLNHFLPGTPVLSFGTAGCNLACKFCLAPGTWIATVDGMRRLEDLFDKCADQAPLAEGQVGFPENVQVWTREARASRVSKVFARPYAGELMALRAACCPPILATPNHGIFAAHRSNLDRVEKISAGDLTRDHYVVVPKRRALSQDISISSEEWLAKLEVEPHAARARRIATEQLSQILRMDGTSAHIGAALGYHPTYVRRLRSDLAHGRLNLSENPRPATLTNRDGRVRFLGERGPGVPATLALTPDLAWLLGIFCAEGCITQHNARPNSFRLSFCFGRHEDELIARTTELLTRLLDTRPAVINRRTTRTVECSQTSVARLFEALCGRGARNKQVPPPLLSASEPVIRAFIEGYLAGDGHRTATHAVALTISERLALGLFELGLHLGLLPTYFEHTPARTKVLEGRTVSQRKLYIVKYLRKRFDPGSDSRPERSAWSETSDYFLVPLKRIQRVPYVGPVYNLEVADSDHSYLAPFLAVANCQNWDISKSRELDTLADAAAPEAIAAAAARLGCRSVAFTYNDPVIFLEYAIDTAAACRAVGIHPVAVTAGYVCPEPRRELFAAMDAANVDLKGFSERFYQKICGGRLAAVLDTLVYLKRETPVWFEVTTLLIPGENDAPDEIEAASAWFVDQLGPDVPWHLTAFHPDYRMLDKPPTPPATLRRAREIARAHGIRHVYTGNVHDRDGQSTYCASCGATLIGRDWYVLSEWNLTGDGRCLACGARCPGVFEGAPGTWGARRVPVRLA